jgi:hypothetical protein
MDALVLGHLKRRQSAHTLIEVSRMNRSELRASVEDCTPVVFPCSDNGLSRHTVTEKVPISRVIPMSSPKKFGPVFSGFGRVTYDSRD